MNATQDNVPFFFKRKIALRDGEQAYVRRCIAETRHGLIQAQRIDPGFASLWDLRNGLTLYLVILGEILAGRTIRYTEPLKPSVCMAAYLGHARMLSILERNGVDVCRMGWNTLNVLFAAILARRFRLVKHLLSAYPPLRAARHLWFGNAGAFCAAFGNLRILRFLRKAGFDLAETHRFPHQPSHDPRHFGSALLFAMRRNRTAIVKDLVAHGEFCPWQNLGGEHGSGTSSVFEEAVRHHFYGVAETYLANGWLDQPATEEAFLELLCRATRHDDLETFLFLETAFPKFGAKRLVGKNHAPGEFGPRILRYCGIAPTNGTASRERNSESALHWRDSIRHWIAMDCPGMIRFTLGTVPEVLPLVWPELAGPIRAAFQAASGDDVSPCRRYLFRLARSWGISLFPDDAARRFWEGNCPRPAPRSSPLSMDEVFPYDEGLEDGYLHPAELWKKLFQALQARGAEARRLMDDPEIDPNADLSWNQPFCVRLGECADWKTYKGWLLRGMEAYRGNLDDPGIFPLASTPSIVRRLLPDLEHRPWESNAFSGNTLVQSAACGDIQAVKALLETGCPVNFSRWVPGHEISPLRAALLNGHDAVARLLHARGGMNLLNGIVLPMPNWISKPRPIAWTAMRRACGDPAAHPILIDPIMPLPAKLDRLRKRWLDDAKELNGNTVCLVPAGTDCIVFHHARCLYALRRESVAMDEEAFEISCDAICRDLESINAHPIPL